MHEKLSISIVNNSDTWKLCASEHQIGFCNGARNYDNIQSVIIIKLDGCQCIWRHTAM